MDNSKYKTTSKMDYKDLSDADFIRNLDVLASSYYADYMQGRAQITGSVDSFFSRTATYDCKASPCPLYPPRRVEFTGYFFKRNFFIFLTFLLSLTELVYLALSFADISFLRDHLPFLKDGTMLSDPVQGLFGGTSSIFSQSGVYPYLVAGGALVFALFSVISFILSCCALFSKRKKDGTYKRVRSGVFTILRLVAVILAGVGAILLDRMVGNGAILLAATSLLSFLFSFAFYRKATALVPETCLDAFGNLKEGYSPLDFLS